MVGLGLRELICGLERLLLELELLVRPLEIRLLGPRKLLFD